MSTRHHFQAIADPQGVNVWIFAGSRRTIRKRLDALTIPRPFRVELWHHTYQGDIDKGTYSCALTRRCRDITIH